MFGYSKQKLIAAGTLWVLVLMTLFPPQIDAIYQIRDDREVQIHEEVTYRFIGGGPEFEIFPGMSTRSRIDLERLFLQWFAAIVIAGGALYLNSESEEWPFREDG